MTFKLDLRVRKLATGTSVLLDGFPYGCGWCGRRFFTPRELTAHVVERRAGHIGPHDDEPARGYGPTGTFTRSQWEAFPGEHYHFRGCGCLPEPQTFEEHTAAAIEKILGA